MPSFPSRAGTAMVLLMFAIGCHPGPVLNRGAQPSVGGTIAGTVSIAGSQLPLVSRKVTAVDVTTGSRYDVTTASNGGFTIKVPEGTYKLDVELRAGETITKQPADTRVNNGDLDAGRDFLVTVKPPGA